VFLFFGDGFGFSEASKISAFDFQASNRAILFITIVFRRACYKALRGNLPGGCCPQATLEFL
jgi:hypothetical protein